MSLTRYFWKKILLELAVIPLTFIAAFSISSHFDVFDQFYLWARKYENTIDIDEISFASFLTLIALVWFSLSRVKESQVLIKRNQSLLYRVIQVQEEERKRIAHDLHDDLGQYINAIKTQAAILSAHETIEVQVLSTKIMSNADHAFNSAKHLITSLRPLALDELGLAVALQYLIETWQTNTENKTKVHFVINDDIDHLNEQTSMIIFRVIQEALTNIAKHADAKNVYISISYLINILTVKIIDDGTGFDIHQKTFGLGLIGIGERIEMLNGKLKIHSALNKGTEISIQIKVIHESTH
jgi:signal transduction histidine kinase